MVVVRLRSCTEQAVCRRVEGTATLGFDRLAAVRARGTLEPQFFSFFHVARFCRPKKDQIFAAHKNVFMIRRNNLQDFVSGSRCYSSLKLHSCTHHGSQYVHEKAFLHHVLIWREE
jgi:predicted RecA/RadA family phage recombinase